MNCINIPNIPDCSSIISTQEMHENILNKLKKDFPQIVKVLNYLNPLWFNSLSFTGNMACYDKKGEYLPFVPQNLSQGFYRYKLEFYVIDEDNFYSGKKINHWVFGKITRSKTK